MIDYKVIKDYPNYGVTKTGEVVSLTTGIIIQPQVNKHGYKTVTLRNNGKNSTKLVHQLVANAYIPNPTSRKTINHIDGDKLNNQVDNLEYVSIKENTIHAYENGLMGTNIFVILEDKVTGKKDRFRSIQHVADELGVYHKLLIPYIRNSKIYPFMGRYVITVEDEDRVLDNANCTKFGKKVYIYDILNKTSNIYNSLGVAMYYTGLRDLGNLTDKIVNAIGFTVSYDKLIQEPKYKHTLEEMSMNRRIYYSKEYSPKTFKIAAIDPFKDINKIYKFENSKEFANFIIKTRQINVDESYFRSVRTRTGNNTKLTCGYIYQFYKNDNDKLNWGSYTLEELYNSLVNRRTSAPVYEVNIDGNKTIQYGTYKLYKTIEPYLPNNKYLDMSLTTSNISKLIIDLPPSIIVKRLNTEIIKI